MLGAAGLAFCGTGMDIPQAQGENMEFSDLLECVPVQSVKILDV